MQALIQKLLFLILFINGLSLRAQYNISWQVCYDLPGEEILQDIVLKNNGFFTLGIFIDSLQILIRNTTQTGELLWEKDYGGSASDGAVKILNLNENNFLILGSTSSIDGDVSFNPYPGNSSLWFFKIDSSGTILWDKVLGGLSADVILDGFITSDSGIVSFGWIEGGGGEVTNFYGDRDMWFIKTDMVGNKLWDYTIGTSAIDYGYCALETHDKSYLLGGTSLVEEGVGGNITCQSHGRKPEAVLFKLDSVGNYEWQRCYGGTEIEVIHKVVELSNGYLLGCTGYSNDGDMTNSGYHLGYYPKGDRTPDVWLVKIDYEGNIIWQKCYGGTQSELIQDFYPLSNGNCIVFANTLSFDGDVIGNHSINEDYFDIWVFEIDSIGNLLWQKCLGGLENEGWIFSTCQNYENNFVIASTIDGRSNGDVSCEANHDYDNGIWMFEFGDSTLSLRANFDLALNLYPIPVDEIMIVELPLKTFGHIAVFDILGTCRLIQKVLDSKIMLDFNTYPNGIYFIQYLDDKGATVSKKIIVNHY